MLAMKIKQLLEKIDGGALEFGVKSNLISFLKRKEAEMSLPNSEPDFNQWFHVYKHRELVLNFNELLEIFNLIKASNQCDLLMKQIWFDVCCAQQQTAISQAFLEQLKDELFLFSMRHVPFSLGVNFMAGMFTVIFQDSHPLDRFLKLKNEDSKLEMALILQCGVEVFKEANLYSATLKSSYGETKHAFAVFNGTVIGHSMYRTECDFTKNKDLTRGIKILENLTDYDKNACNTLARFYAGNDVLIETPKSYLDAGKVFLYLEKAFNHGSRTAEKLLRDIIANDGKFGHVNLEPAECDELLAKRRQHAALPH